MEMFGSVFNRTLEYAEGKTPEVGMGATECGWSDRHAYEVIEVIDDRHIIVRRLDAKRTDNNGVSDSQDYEFTSNPNNHTCKLFLTKQGRWRERIGRRLGCNGWLVGKAMEYYDYSF